jgi:hypothetical protein
LVGGKLAGVSVIILLDSGAQTNLVSRSFVENNLHVHLVPGSIRLRFGDNNEAASLGQLRNLDVEASGIKVRLPVVNVSPFSMLGCDLILGTPFWQQTKGGLYIDPTTRFVFPSGECWHGLDDRSLFGGVDTNCDIGVIQGARPIRQYFQSNKNLLDRYVINLMSVDVPKAEMKNAVAQGIIHPAISKMLDEFADVARETLPTVIERTEGVDIDEAFMKIPLKDGALPKAHRAFPMSQGEMLVLQQMLAELLEKNYIEPSTGASGWSAPIFLLRKPGQREGVPCYSSFGLFGGFSVP